MKNVGIWTACLLLTATGVRAQQGLELGVKGGATLSGLLNSGNGTPFSKGYGSRLSWGAGIFGEVRFDDRFSLTVGLEYSRQGAQKNGMQAYPAQAVTINFSEKNYLTDIARSLFPDEYVYLNYNNKVFFDCLMLPVQGRIGWNLSPTSPWRVYAGAGLFASYTVNAERIMAGNDHLFSDPHGRTLTEYVDPLLQEITSLSNNEKNFIHDIYQTLDQLTLTLDRTDDLVEGLHPFTFGVIGHAGVSYRFCGRHKVFVEGGGHYGLGKIQKEAPNGANRIAGASVMLGYSFALRQ